MIPYKRQIHSNVLFRFKKTDCTIQNSLSNGVKETIARPIKLYGVGVIAYTVAENCNAHVQSKIF